MCNIEIFSSFKCGVTYLYSYTERCFTRHATVHIGYYTLMHECLDPVCHWSLVDHSGVPSFSSLEKLPLKEISNERAKMTFEDLELPRAKVCSFMSLVHHLNLQTYTIVHEKILRS